MSILALPSAAITDSTTAGRALLTAADAAAQRSALDLEVGVDVQAFDADLSTWAGVTPGTGVTTALSTNVGSAGALVVNGGALGTPASGTLTNCTGLPVATGLSGAGTGVATALAVNVGSAGAFVANGGALGTPSSGTLANCTGLAVSTGVSGLGTGVATALAVNVGSAGALVANGGALGTPASGTMTNCTGLPIATGVSGLGSGVADALAISAGSSGGVVTVGGALGTPLSGTLTNCIGLPISGVSGWIRNRKDSQTDKTNATVLNVAGLSISVTSGKTYHFRAHVVLTLNATGGMQLGIGNAGLATFSRTDYSIDFSGTSGIARKNCTALDDLLTHTGSTSGVAIIEGTLVCTGTGTVQFRFAQATGSGTSSILIGSSVIQEEI